MTPEERAERITQKWGKLRDALGYSIEYDLVKEIQEAQTEAIEAACGKICADCGNGRSIQYVPDWNRWLHHLDDGLHYDFCKAEAIRSTFGPFTTEKIERSSATSGDSKQVEDASDPRQFSDERPWTPDSEW